MEFSFLNITSIVFDFIAVILIFFLLTIQSERRLSNILLALFLFLYILDFSAQYVSYFIYPISGIAGMLISNLILLVPPILYLFVKSSIYRDFSLNSRMVIHLLPYILINILLIPGYYIMLINGEFTDQYEIEFYKSDITKLSYLGLHIQIFAYYIGIFLLLRKYRKILKENFSNPDLGNYKWLIQFSFLLFMDSFISLFKNIIQLYNFPNLDVAINIVVAYIMIFIIWLMLRALQNPGLFKGIYSHVLLVKDILKESGTEISISQSKINALETEEDKILANNLDNYMRDNEPYLNPSLSLAELALQMEISPKDLSLFINHKLNKHFFDFVNEYRIEKARELLSDPSSPDLTVLEVLYEVGFNSKSSFNTLFKKYTGLTPTEYRKKAWRSAA